MPMPALFAILLLMLINPSIALPGGFDKQQLSEFIDEMVTRHDFEYGELESLFRQANLSQPVIEAISRPAEALPWYRYRALFVVEDRIVQGVEFWHAHSAALAKAERRFGVPAEIIVAIIGVETRYGRNTGDHRVLDALATLAFNFPSRAAFFRGELEQYLLLTREQGLDPLRLTGSYAGAMGIPQFIASSYRHYAIDFDGDGFADIWRNPADAIGSIGNYFLQHDWRAGGPVALPARVTGEAYRRHVSSNPEPGLEYRELQASGVEAEIALPSEARVALLEFAGERGAELWLALHNFYVITRYNHSANYALAVYQLAQEIRGRYAAQMRAGGN